MIGCIFSTGYKDDQSACPKEAVMKENIKEWKKLLLLLLRSIEIANTLKINGVS